MPELLAGRRFCRPFEGYVLSFCNTSKTLDASIDQLINRGYDHLMNSTIGNEKAAFESFS